MGLWGSRLIAISFSISLLFHDVDFVFSLTYLIRAYKLRFCVDCGLHHGLCLVFSVVHSPKSWMRLDAHQVYETPPEFTNMTAWQIPIFNREYIFKWWMCCLSFQFSGGYVFRCWGSQVQLKLDLPLLVGGRLPTQFRVFVQHRDVPTSETIDMSQDISPCFFHHCVSLEGTLAMTFVQCFSGHLNFSSQKFQDAHPPNANTAMK